jgi:hypothetical protein
MTVLASKVVNPFTPALAPPFIGRRRDIYIPTIPLSPKNISSVNAHTNVFYISYIYKLTTSSHAKPELFEMTSLTLLLASSWIFPLKKSSRTMIPELALRHTPEFYRFPKFVVPQVRGFKSSQIRDFEASQVQDSKPSRARDSEGSWVSASRSSRVRDSETLWVWDSRSSRVLCSWKLN